MESVRILVAISNDVSLEKLRSILAENGYIVVDQARDGNECLRKMNALRPDISIIDYNLSSISGYEVSKIALEDKLCDILLIISEAQKNYIEELIAEPGFFYIAKPLSRITLINVIELIIKNRKRIRELEKQIDDLKNALDTRKEVEKAKGILMKTLNLTEAEAYKRIQKQSMDRGIPMKEIARAIILAYDINA